LQDLLERKVENHENHETKENRLKYEDILKARMDEREKKIQSLQKRMEKMKSEYELRIRELKDQIQKKLDVKSVEYGSSRKVKDLESQVSVWNPGFGVLKETYLPWRETYYSMLLCRLLRYVPST
jgi:vacuolar-type H+-ATPase subunit I/STV1